MKGVFVFAENLARVYDSFGIGVLLCALNLKQL